MIVVSPYDVVQNQKQLVEFYRLQLNSMGVGTRRVTVAPYQQQGDFDVTAVDADQFFDIANAQNGNIAAANIGTYGLRNKSFLQGYLALSTYVAAKSTVDPGRYNLSLCSGSGIAPTSWLFKRRNNIINYDLNNATPAAPGLNAQGFVDLTTPPGIMRTADLFLDQFPSMLFNYVRLAVGVDLGTMTVRVEYIFNGIRIDYN